MTMRNILVHPLLIGILSVSVSGCSLVNDHYRDDFEQYKNVMRGNCDWETDAKDYILPSEDFIDKFEYKEARYYHYETALFDVSNFHAFSYLYFEYSDEVYFEAKDFMLSEVKAFNDHYEHYHDFVFLESAKTVEKRNLSSTKIESEFPEWFWMLGYNDVSKSMLFCGFYNDLNEYTTWDDLLEKTVLLTLDI